MNGLGYQAHGGFYLEFLLEVSPVRFHCFGADAEVVAYFVGA